MSNGTVNELGELHGIIARTLTDQLKNGVTQVSKDGTIEVISAPASVLNVARQFLRDNNIECSGATNADVKALTESLPFEPEESIRPN
jgi:hypothetical protein|tara:strand:- start:595 stop:858 length:264 start_codon:yes stop_codon:yes gene_type:complete